MPRFPAPCDEACVLRQGVPTPLEMLPEEAREQSRARIRERAAKALSEALARPEPPRDAPRSP